LPFPEVSPKNERLPPPLENILEKNLHNQITWLISGLPFPEISPKNERLPPPLKNLLDITCKQTD
jgi:hypothetical protein